MIRFLVLFHAKILNANELTAHSNRAPTTNNPWKSVRRTIETILLLIIIQFPQIVEADEAIRVRFFRMDLNGTWFDLHDARDQYLGTKVVIENYFIDQSEKGKILTLWVEPTKKTPHGPSGNFVQGIPTNPQTYHAETTPSHATNPGN